MNDTQLGKLSLVLECEKPVQLKFPNNSPQKVRTTAKKKNLNRNK